jgi:glycosyltransferase involved in cell wall biosynthesis
VLCYAVEAFRLSITACLPRQNKFKRCSLSSLTVTVITKNEEQNIEACLRSVPFADQWVVLDSGSVDATTSLAGAAGAEVFVNSDWQGFGMQKNRALALARCDWILSLDADERVSPELGAEIEAVLASPQFDVYDFPRLSSYCGQNMLHSGWYPDRVTRLFRRGAAKFSDDLVHESIMTGHAVGQLQSPLLHDSFRSLEEVLEKVNSYSSAGARSLHNRGKRSSLGKALTHGIWAFVRTYLLRRGFLDGRMGLVLAISNAEGTYYRYLKLWLINREASKPPSES